MENWVVLQVGLTAAENRILLGHLGKFEGVTTESFFCAKIYRNRLMPFATQIDSTPECRLSVCCKIVTLQLRQNQKKVFASV